MKGSSRLRTLNLPRVSFASLRKFQGSGVGYDTLERAWSKWRRGTASRRSGRTASAPISDNEWEVVGVFWFP